MFTPLKIAFVSGLYPPYIGGGAERTVQRLCLGMQQRGHTVEVFSTGLRDDENLHSGIPVTRVAFDNFYWHYRTDFPSQPLRLAWYARDRDSSRISRKFDSFIRRFSPDIVSFHNIAGLGRGIWSKPALHGAKTVQVLHDLYLSCPNTAMFRSGHLCERRCGSCTILRAGYKKSSNTIDCVVGISQSTLQEVTRFGLFSTSKQIVINNAQDLSPNLRNLLPLSAPATFGFIGSLTRSKGVDWLIKRFPHDVPLVIAGKGSTEYTDYLRKLAIGKKITFVGQVDSSDFYARVNVVVIPSLWKEPLGGVAIEASAHGRAVIASNRGGLPEVIKDGRNGLIFDPNHCGDIERCINSIASEQTLRVALGTNGPEVTRHFTNFERFLQDYENLYYSIL